MPRIDFYRSLLFLIRVYSNLLAPFNKKGIVFPFFLIRFHILFAKNQRATLKGEKGVCSSVDFHLEYHMEMRNLKNNVTGRSPRKRALRTSPTSRHS
jgi:hypothetical protein